jgi:hypothetical protein
LKEPQRYERGGITYAAALETIPSSLATAWKSGWCQVSGARKQQQVRTRTYAAVGSVANARDEELDLVGGVLLRHLEGRKRYEVSRRWRFCSAKGNQQATISEMLES